MSNAWRKYDDAVKQSGEWDEILSAAQEYARTIDPEYKGHADHLVAALLAARIADRNKETT